MVSKEEIEKIAKLMRIEIDDHIVHMDRVERMIQYFEILDRAGVEQDELVVQEQRLENLREDKYIPFDKHLIDKLKNYKSHYVKAPKMI